MAPELHIDNAFHGTPIKIQYRTGRVSLGFRRDSLDRVAVTLGFSVANPNRNVAVVSRETFRPERAYLGEESGSGSYLSPRGFVTQGFHGTSRDGSDLEWWP